MQITILNQKNEPQGPFTRSEVAQRLQSGEFNLGSLAFIDSLQQWTPLRDVLAQVDAGAPDVTATHPPIMPPIAQKYSYAATMQPPAHLEYAGFWIRFGAYLIDSLILSVVFTILLVPVGVIVVLFAGKSGSSFDSSQASVSTTEGIVLAVVQIAISGILLVGSWLYFAMMESGKSQGSWGKRALGLRVTNLAGERLRFGQASGRFFGKMVSGLTFSIGYIMAAFTDKKQALHDMIAGTLVVKG